MGFMSKATRDKLRGLRRVVPDNVKGRVTGPTKDATGEPNSQSPRRSSGGLRRSSGGLRRRSFGGGSSQPPTPAPQQRARNPELQQASAKMDAARARQQSRSGGTPRRGFSGYIGGPQRSPLAAVKNAAAPSTRNPGGNIDMNRRSARSGTAGGRPAGGRPAGGNIDTNRLMARSGRAGGRARMFSEGGEAKKTGGTTRGCGMAKPSKFKIY